MLFFEAISRGDFPLGKVFINHLTHIYEGCLINRNNEIPGTLCRHHCVPLTLTPKQNLTKLQYMKLLVSRGDLVMS